MLIGGGRAELGGDLAGGYYIQPTLFKGHNKMRIFREEIFGPVLAVTTFKDEAEALADRQRHALRPGRRRVDARRQHRLPDGPRHQGGQGLDQLLPRLPGARHLRRLQGVGHRPRDPQDDARPLPADQEPAGELFAEEARVLLKAAASREAEAAGARPRTGSGSVRVSNAVSAHTRC